MNTAFLLMAQYDALAVIPAHIVVRDYFPHLNTENFLRKVAVGDINIPLIRIEPGSQKSAKGVHLIDLAQYLDERRSAAQKEARQLSGA
nr:pyocin activator PrtN family protein [uncultured Rhodoferax sp.]